jgi:hypothetical protein
MSTLNGRGYGFKSRRSGLWRHVVHPENLHGFETLVSYRNTAQYHVPDL